MATLVRHVFLTKIKLRCTCITAIRRPCMYFRNCANEIRFFSTAALKNSDSQSNEMQNKPEDDLDFFGLKETTEDSIIFSKELENIDVHEFEIHNKSKAHDALKQQMPFGWVRYDKRLDSYFKTEATVDEVKADCDTNVKQISKSQRKREKRLHLRQHHENVNLEKTYLNENESVALMQSKPDSKLAYIDKQYFQSSSNELKKYSEKVPKSPFERKTPINETEYANGFPYIDQQYFQNDARSPKIEQLFDSKGDISVGTVCPEVNNEQDMSFIDDQYFDYDIPNKKKLEVVTQSTNTKSKQIVKKEMSFIDEQYFESDSKDVNNYIQENTSLPTFTEHGSSFSDNRQHKRNEKHFFQFIDHEDLDGKESMTLTMKENISLPEQHDSEMEKHKLMIKKKSEKDNHMKPKSTRETGITKPETAFDVAMELREKNQMKTESNIRGKMDPKEYDSRGFRILTNQVPHFRNAPSVDIINVLRENIIYNDNDIVAINKPYGLASHGGPGIVNSIGQLRHEIIPKVDLHLVHRLDKETTGVMLLGKTEEMAKKLHECFYRREVIKRYLAITKNIPEMSKGEIDIPVKEGTIDGKVRMVLRPYKSAELSPVMKKRQDGKEAVTRYRVLDQGDQCAVLECIPLTGLKHQIRVHLAFGLNCPILGDHKYAHINKMAPMRLHPGILRMLKIQQSKVRNLAMHLHARSILIPEFLDGRNLFVSAPLPLHFMRNMRDLKMKLPSRM